MGVQAFWLQAFWLLPAQAASLLGQRAQRPPRRSPEPGAISLVKKYGVRQLAAAFVAHCLGFLAVPH
jgi:hypothetical protein